MNIAEIGFAADSSQLRSAKTALDQLSPSAHAADAASQELSSSMSKLQNAAAGVTSTSKAASAALGHQETAAASAAAAQQRLNSTMAQVSRLTAQGAATAGAASSASALAQQEVAAQGAAAAQQRLADAAQGNAATAATAKAAATGLDQQASAASAAATATTQAAAAQQRLADAAQGNAATAATAKAAAAALGQQEAAATQAAAAQRQLANTTQAVATQVHGVGISTSNLAAQFQDVAVSAAGGMNPLLIALQQGTQISAALQQSATSGAGALAQIGTAAASVVSPLALATIGIVAAGAALLQLVPWSKVAAASLRAFANGLDYAKSTILRLTPLLGTVAAILGTWFVIRTLIPLVYALTAAMIRLTFSVAAFMLLNPFGLFLTTVIAAAVGIAKFNDKIKELTGIDLVSSFKKSFNFIASGFVGIWNVMKYVWNNYPEMVAAGLDKSKAILLDYWDGVKKGFTNMRESWNEVQNALKGGVILPERLKGTIDPFADDAQRAAAGESARDFGAEMQAKFLEGFGKDWTGLIGGSVSKGVDAIKKKLREWAAKLDEVDKKYEKLVDGIKSQIAVAQTEMMVIGMATAEAEKYKTMTELLNKAREDGRKLGTKQIAQLEKYADLLGRVKDQTEKLKEAFDLAKDIVRGFITDLRDSLVQGESILKAFVNAAVNILNKITDKLISRLVDLLFASNKGADGGILGSLVKLLGGVTGASVGGGEAVGTWTTTTTKGFAKGGVVNSPTAFKFASGGSFANGVMGEAGPEAIMPLKRGPDGSLGVAMHGSNDNTGSATSTVVNIYNNADGTQVEQRRSRDSNGTEMIDVIISAVKNKLATGEFDQAMKARYGGAPTKTIRG